MNIFYINDINELGVFNTYEEFFNEEKDSIKIITQKEAVERFSLKRVNAIKDHSKLFYIFDSNGCIKELISDNKDTGYTEVEMVRMGYRKKLSDFYLLNHKMIYLGKIKSNSANLKENISAFLGTKVYSGLLFKFKADVFKCKRNEYIFHKYVGKNTYEIYAILQY